MPGGCCNEFSLWPDRRCRSPRGPSPPPLPTFATCPIKFRLVIHPCPRATTVLTPTLPITLIDTEILDDWFARPQVWDVLRDLQHARHVLALVRYMLPTLYKGQPAIVLGASFLFIPAYQACTNLRDGLTFLKSTKEDSVILVVTPSKPTYSPQPQRSRYLTLLPISGSPDMDRGPLHTFAAAGLPVASKEGVVVTCLCMSRCCTASGPPSMAREN